MFISGKLWSSEHLPGCIMQAGHHKGFYLEVHVLVKTLELNSKRISCQKQCEVGSHYFQNVDIIRNNFGSLQLHMIIFKTQDGTTQFINLVHSADLACKELDQFPERKLLGRHECFPPFDFIDIYQACKLGRWLLLSFF